MSKRISEFPAVSNPSYMMPPQLITEEERFDKSGEWFYKMLCWIGSFYNRPVTNSFLGQSGVYGTNNQQDADGYNVQPSLEMIKLLSYYLGKQANNDYAWLTQNVTGTNLQAIWRKGQDIAPLIDNIRGNGRRALQNIKFSCKPISEEAYSERMEMYNKLMLKVELKEEFEKLANLGAEFNPAGRDFDKAEDVDKWMDEEYKQYGSQMATDITTDTWNSNSMINKFLRGLDYGAICGLAGLEHRVENSKYIADVIMPYQAIYDPRIDDDLNTKAQFAGVIRNLTVGEIFERYPFLPPSTRKEIESMAQDNKLYAPYNAMANNYAWWTPLSGMGTSTISVMTVYFKCPRDMDIKTVINKYGVEAVEEIKDRKSQIKKAEDNLVRGKINKEEYDQILEKLNGDFILDDVYQATLIGGKWLVDYGYYNNVSENPLNKDPMLPISFWLPNMFGGESRSCVARLKSIQDELDMYRFQMKEMVGRAMGKVWFIRGDKLGNNTSILETIKDLKEMGGTVLTTSGEIQEAMDSGKAVEVADLSLDPNFQNIQNIIVSLKNEMMEIISTSRIALGQQTSYIGATTQASSINQSNLGQTPILSGFIDWVVYNMQYSLNVRKNLFIKYPSLMNAAVTIGDKGVRYFTEVLSEDLIFEDFLLYLHTQDVIEQDGRARLIAYAQAWSQNPVFGIMPHDIVKMEKSNTYTEAVKILEDAFKRTEIKSNEREKMQQQIDQMNTQQHIQAQQQAKMEDYFAKIYTELTTIDRKGLWKMREEEYKITMDNKINAELEQAPAMPQMPQS